MQEEGMGATERQRGRRNSREGDGISAAIRRRDGVLSDRQVERRNGAGETGRAPSVIPLHHG